MKTPKVSVALVTMNRRDHLRRTLERLFEDDFPDREIVVADGASRDGTVEYLESLGDRVRWVSGKDRGEYDAWNKVTAMCRGEILKWLPDDDRLRPGATARAVAYLDAHPNVDIVFGQTKVWLEAVDGTLTPFRETAQAVPRFAMRDWIHGTQGVMSVGAFVRRAAAERIGPFSLDYVAADMEYWMRAVSKGIRMDVIPDTVVDYSVTGQNLHITREWRITRDLLRIHARYGSPADVAWTVWNRRLTFAAAAFHRFDLHPWQAWRRLRERVGI